jgi:O-antigen/teichoic acid export membrane protein
MIPVRPSPAKNTALVLAGQVVPLVAAIFCMPVTLRSYGTERIGVMSLLFALISYLTLLDLGLSRALTKSAAELIAANKNAEVRNLYRTATLAQGVLGTIAGLVAVALAVRFLDSSSVVPVALRGEALAALVFTAASLPVVLMVASTAGVLQALERFDLVARAQILGGLTNYLIPVILIPWTKNLAAVMGSMVVVRVLTLWWTMNAALRLLPWERPAKASTKHLVSLLKIGGWIAATAFVGPLLVYADRFLIGALISLGAVTYYTVPADLATRTLLLPAAASQAMFPQFAAGSGKELDRLAMELFGTTLRLVLIPVGLVASVCIGASGDLFRIWLGSDFSTMAAQVFRIFMVGVVVNALGSLPLSLIQARGRPDLSARLHLAELPLYVVAVWIAARAGGIEGVAMAWLGRVCLDTTLMTAIAMRVGAMPWRFLFTPPFVKAVLIVTCAVGISWGAAGLPTPAGRALAALVTALAATMSCWRFSILQKERKAMVAGLRSILASSVGT